MAGTPYEGWARSSLLLRNSPSACTQALPLGTDQRVAVAGAVVGECSPMESVLVRDPLDLESTRSASGC